LWRAWGDLQQWFKERVPLGSERKILRRGFGFRMPIQGSISRVLFSAIIFSVATLALAFADEPTIFTVELGKHPSASIQVEEEWSLKGDVFSIESKIKFYGYNRTNSSTSIIMDRNKDYAFFDYEQYDYLENKLVKSKKYLERIPISEDTVEVRFPPIEVKNSSEYVAVEKYKIKTPVPERNFVFSGLVNKFPFDDRRFNKTINYKGLRYSFALTLVVPKSYDVRYYEGLEDSAIEGFFVDTTSEKISQNTSLTVITCLSEHRKFSKGIENENKIVIFPTVYIPSEEEDPCPFIPKSSRVHVLITRDDFVKQLFYVFLMIQVAFLFLILYYRDQKFRFKLFGGATTVFIFQEGYLPLSSIHRPFFMTLWDLIILIPLFGLFISTLINRKIRKKGI
jgi:hypothetical protein